MIIMNYIIKSLLITTIILSILIDIYKLSLTLFFHRNKILDSNLNNIIISYVFKNDY